tara:strand:- start:19496 stop:20176 length:681 start_codon:yes stop_codon:yes gene_type:complete
MTNVLYFGYNNEINNIVFNLLKEEYKFTKVNKHIYKQLTYEETNDLFIFHSKPSMIFVEMINKLIESKNITGNRHVILIYNIEELTQEYFYYFRILLERFYKNCVFYATTIKLNTIETPIRSRFFIKNIKTDFIKIETPIYNIKKKPLKTELKKLAHKLKNYELKDICLDILKITPYKRDFIKIASNIDHMYAISNKKEKELFIELILLEGFYPDNITKEIKKLKI